MLAFTFLLAQVAETQQPMVLPPPPKWEDIPRPFRTAAEDCVWNHVQKSIGTAEPDESEAAAIGRKAVEVCDSSISAWADSLEGEVHQGELPEIIKQRLQNHLAARGQEFALRKAERFYMDEDRGESTKPSYRMSFSCEAKARRVKQRFFNLDKKFEELSESFGNDWDRLKRDAEFLEFQSTFESNINRFSVLKRDCPKELGDYNIGTFMPSAMKGTP